MAGGRFSLASSILGAMIIWTFTLSMYTIGIPANTLLAAKAVLVMIVILLYSDQLKTLLNRFGAQKGGSHVESN